MEHMLSLLSQYGLWIVFVGMIVEGTTVIILSGVLCHMGVLPCEQTIIVAILGAAVGDQMWFYIGRNYAQKFLSKFPRIQLQVKKIQTKVHSKADLLAVSSRFIYGGAVVFPLVLGMHQYAHKRFTTLDTLGVSLASIAGLAIGYLLSHSFKKLLGDIGQVEHLIFFIIIFIIAIKLYITSRTKHIDSHPDA